MAQGIKFTKETFEKKAKIIHGNKYNYNKVVYINSYTKVIITCPIHGDFEQTPQNHLHNMGCKKCSNDKKTYSFLDFVNKSNIVHKFKYKYNEKFYTKIQEKVTIICPIHGEFEQLANSHLQGKGCSKCSYDSKKISLNQFIQKSKEIHGKDKFDYSKTIYINTRTPVCIICKIHGEFWQTPNVHLGGHGCKECSKSSEARFNASINKKLTNEKYINIVKKVHANKYDYSKVIYNGSKKYIEIICPIKNHGIFKQLAGKHISGDGCPKCSAEATRERCALPQEEWIEKAKEVHGDKYCYDNVKYINWETNVDIICNICGSIFTQRPNNHISGMQGCPICRLSKGEEAIKKWLEKNSINFILQYKFEDCKNIRALPFDFYLFEYNLCIEYDGALHYKSVKYFGGEESLKEIQYKDSIKNQYCKNNNIKLLRIPYTEFKNINQILQKEILSCQIEQLHRMDVELIRAQLITA